MRQELVFIGQNLDQAQTQKTLNEDLLTQAEMLEDQQVWRHLRDPFPTWVITG
jgi:hypothetical protein